jgi:hypothetical protein
MGFTQSVPPGAATQRGGKQLAEDAGSRRSAAGQHARSADFAPINVPGGSRRHNDFLGGFLGASRREVGETALE